MLTNPALPSTHTLHHPSSPFSAQISSLVGERDAGLRLSLSNMGMSQAAYWTSWMAFDTLLTLATAVLLVLFGKAGQPGCRLQ